jgi:hypothetical protein
VKVFLSYLVKVKEDLYLYWDKTIDDASMTPQIIYLERYLNFVFEQTTIFINEGYTLGPWIFLDTETPSPDFFMDEDDSFIFSFDDAILVDFTVNIPAVIEGQTSRIAAIVHKYKLPSKSFIIQIF